MKNMAPIWPLGPGHGSIFQVPFLIPIRHENARPPRVLLYNQKTLCAVRARRFGDMIATQHCSQQARAAAESNPGCC